MPPIFDPHPYQSTARDFLTYHCIFEPHGVALWLDPGLGKTAISLQTIYDLRQLGKIRRALVVAPLRVMNETWPAEITKWRFPLTIARIHGTVERRRMALAADADIHLINPEGIAWLHDELRSKSRPPRWDLTFLDESTKFKHWGSGRTRRLRKMTQVLGKVTELTGTPAANSYTDLHAQIYFLDGGKALGETQTKFRAEFCVKENVNGFPRWVMQKQKIAELERRIAPLVLRMEATDHLDMPQIVFNPIWVKLPDDIMSEYRRLEQLMFLSLDGGKDIVASTAGSRYAMCRSVANGGVYETDDLGNRTSHYVHDAKVQAVRDLYEDLGGKPLLVAFQFHHDRDRLLKAFPNTPVLQGGMNQKDVSRIISGWNSRDIPLLFAQPQSVGHGLNLQAGGNDLCWFGLTDQPEVHTQMNARLWRQGVEGQVRIHYLLAKGTIDRMIFNRIRSKDQAQQTLVRSIQNYRENHDYQYYAST